MAVHPSPYEIVSGQCVTQRSSLAASACGDEQAPHEQPSSSLDTAPSRRSHPAEVETFQIRRVVQEELLHRPVFAKRLRSSFMHVRPSITGLDTELTERVQVQSVGPKLAGRAHGRCAGEVGCGGTCRV